MNKFLNFYMRARSITSFVAGIFTTLMLIVIFTSAAFSQETPNPSPTVAPTPEQTNLPGDVIVSPTPLPTATPVVSPPAPAPPTDMPNLNDNPPQLPDIPPAPPFDPPNYDNTPRPLPAPDRVGVDLTDQTPLSIEDAIRLALENNNDIEIAGSDVKTAELNLTIANGAYVPQVVGETYFRRSTVPTASTLSGANGSLTETSFVADAGLQGQVPFQGGSFSSNFQSNRATTNNTFTSLNPQYPSSLNFQYVQPLFRGRKFDQTRRQIEIAKKNLTLTDAQFRQRVIEIIAQIEQAYWDLAYSQRNLQVQLDGVKLANAQVSSNERQVEQGVLAPSDVLAAKVQVSTFEQQVYLAQQAVTNAENNLKNLMLADRNSPMWSNPIVPITPVNLNPPKFDLQNSLTTAMANRPEIQQLETTAEINRIDQRFFKDQTKPQIDLVGSYTSAGLAGTEIATNGTSFLTSGLAPLITRINDLSALNNLPPITLGTGGTGGNVPGNLTGGYFQSLTNVLLQRYPTFQVGVRVAIPFKNTVAKAQFGQTLVQETRIKSQRDKQELQIETEVRNALQNIRSQQSRLQAATEARSAAEQLYESEQRKNLAGTSTTFLVLQRQTDLINARGREVQAQTDLNKAITQFQRSIGTTLDAAGVSLNKQTPTFSRPKRTEITTVFGESLNK